MEIPRADQKNCVNARYNRGHEVIAEMEKHFGRVWVLTQNIDGFHRAAGSSRNVIDIHGDMRSLVCPSCLWRGRIERYSGIGITPRCPACSCAVRPDVVFSGEMLAEEKLLTLERELKRGFDLYFSVGTTAVFPYIRYPIESAGNRGKPVIEINPDETSVSGLVSIAMRMRAAEALDEIWKLYAGA